LFGEFDAPSTPGGGTPGVDYEQLVNSGDNWEFLGSKNNPGNYLAYFDFDGDGDVDNADGTQFSSRFNKPLTWSV
jgi:hypothetical protein